MATGDKTSKKLLFSEFTGVMTALSACALSFFYVLLCADNPSSFFVSLATLAAGFTIVLFLTTFLNNRLGKVVGRVALLTLAITGMAVLLIGAATNNLLMRTIGSVGLPLMLISFSCNITSLKHKYLSLSCLASLCFIAIVVFVSAILHDATVLAMAAAVSTVASVFCKGMLGFLSKEKTRFVDTEQSVRNNAARPNRITSQLEWGVAIGACTVICWFKARELFVSERLLDSLLIPFAFVIAGIVIVFLFFCLHTRYEKCINASLASFFIFFATLSLISSLPIDNILVAFMLIFIVVLTTSYLDGIASENRFLGLSPFWHFGNDLSFTFLAFTLSVVLMGAFSMFDMCGIAVTILCTLVCALQTKSSLCAFPDSDSLGEQCLSGLDTISQADNQNDNDKAAVRYILDSFNLTPRQKEVFEMLAKGRNAAYISEYYYISYSTAKTHIHNLYNKLGVHSQQEMITLIELLGYMTSEERDEFAKKKPL